MTVKKEVNRKDLFLIKKNARANQVAIGSSSSARGLWVSSSALLILDNEENGVEVLILFYNGIEYFTHNVERELKKLTLDVDDAKLRQITTSWETL